MTISRRTALGLFAGAALTSACQAGGADARKAAESGFTAFSQTMLNAMARQSPLFATWLGDHRFDGELDDLSAAGRTAAATTRQDLRQQLAAIDFVALPPGAQVDAAIARNRLDLDDWAAEAETFAFDPASYSDAAGGALYGLIARDFAPLKERLLNAAARMEKLPAVFAAARAGLDPVRTPKVFAETYARQHPGVMGLIDGVILPQASALGPEDAKRLKDAAERLRTAATEHQAWINSTLLSQAAGQARIGSAMFDRKLALALASPMSRADIKAKAQAALEKTRAEMADIAGKILGPRAPKDQQTLIQAALERAYQERPARGDVLKVARETLARATEFTRAKDLITLPDAPVEVIVMPEFQQGVAVAYCDSPGPLDKGQKTFYAVSPIPAAWTNQQSDSFLREYNVRSIHELTIHEAMPGHYVQLWHANRYPSTLRAAFYSGTFVEGWACYAQDMLGEEGYYGEDLLGGLINRKWRLRLISNALLDQGIHVDEMSREDAMTLMTKTAFQEEREAAGKWVRAQVTSTQLSTYFVGWAEHYALRDRVRAHKKENFALKRYHDDILSFGSPPTQHVEALLFGEAIKV
jgi:uncharacterized protein (DUF885 family)